MAQIEHPDNLARFTNPACRLATLILIRAGLRISDALRLSRDCLVLDQEGAPYLRYVNHKMRRQAVPGRGSPHARPARRSTLHQRAGITPAHECGRAPRQQPPGRPHPPGRLQSLDSGYRCRLLAEEVSDG